MLKQLAHVRVWVHDQDEALAFSSAGIRDPSGDNFRMAQLRAA